MRIWFLSATPLVVLGVAAIVLQLSHSILRSRPLTVEAYRGWETMALGLASMWLLNQMRMSLGGLECYSNGILFFGRLVPWETIRGFTWLDSPSKLRLHLLGDKTYDCAVGREHRADVAEVLTQRSIPECSSGGGVTNDSVRRILDERGSDGDGE